MYIWQGGVKIDSFLVTNELRFEFRLPVPEVCGGVTTVYHEGKAYNTVAIGAQCWLRENINAGTRINGSQNMSNNGILEKYCYLDNEANCDIYGGLYQWNEAMRYTLTPGAQGICPLGWHIPTETEYRTLAATVINNGNDLKSIGQGIGNGQGTNASGFSALLAGYRFVDGSYNTLGEFAYFGSSSEHNSGAGKVMYLVHNASGIVHSDLAKTYGLSIRCLKN
ncbi:MAG: hypothetical protein HUU54_16855 [Ignavibacteriaceae bacterium]|nr:hypothetical protein [Ignavibacteriaceae bacterium]